MFMLNKGAMFGLDARIALAIFGALSVISGAALYSAIEESKVVARAAEMREFAKAIEQYLLDHGSDIEKTGTSSYFKLEHLLTTNGKSEWNGPYMPWNSSSMYAGTKSIYFYNGGSSSADDEYYSLNFLTGGTWATSASCSSGLPCHYYIRLGRIPDAFADKLDAYFDGSASEDTGVVKTTLHSAGHKNVYMKGPLMFTQP
jgi:type II secretory pathway pseudopilin PulG